MCDFQQLYQGNSGFVMRCSSCNTYQLCFGNTVMTLYPEEFAALKKITGQRLTDNYYIDEGTRNIFMPTFSGSVCLLLTRAELRTLHLMLEAADTEAQALSLIALFYT